MDSDIKIYSRNHRYDRIYLPMYHQDETEIEEVKIRDDLLINSSSIILPGVNIGKGAIIVAGL